MIEPSKSIKLILVAATVSLISCQAETSQSTNQPVAKAPAQQSVPQVQTMKPAYDFERQLQNCVGTICKLGDIKKMSMSDYNPALIAEMGLTQMDTLASARKKITGFYSGMISSGLGETTDPKLKKLEAQLSEGNQGDLPEYDIIIRTEGMSNGAQVRDWGARIRCAPVAASSPWQTTPC